MEQAINAVQIGNQANKALDSTDLLSRGNAAKNKSKADKIANNAEESSLDGLLSFSRLLNQHLAEVSDRAESANGNNENTGETVASAIVKPNDDTPTKDEMLVPSRIMQVGENVNVEEKITAEENSEKYLPEKDTRVKPNDSGTSGLISENNFTNSGREGFIAGQELQKNRTNVEPLNENKKTKLNARIFSYGQEMSADKITAKGDDAPNIHTDKISSIEDAHVKSNKSFNETNSGDPIDENHSIKENMRFSVPDAKIKDSSQQNPAQQQNIQGNIETLYNTKAETVQSLWSELNEKIKSDYRSKNISIEKKEDNISLTSLNSAMGAIKKEEKATTINSPEIINKIANEIKESALTEGGRIKITLNPSSLGTLEMEVLVHNNKVEVILTANNKDVQQLLNSNLDQLKSTLQNQGLTVERCDVMMSDRQDDFYRSFGNASYFQDQSDQDGRERGSETKDEKLSLATSTDKKTKSILRVGTETDKISLFA